MSTLKELFAAGQSAWLDSIDRKLIESGELNAGVADGLRGLTSNPAIFEKAIGEGVLYDSFIKSTLSAGDLDSKGLYEKIAIRDICDAADLLKPVFESSKGVDGYVSLEVSPYLARDTQGTIVEGKRLWHEVNRPNLMIKVPGTVEGVPAIEELIFAGLNINVTLLFSLEMYEKVADAYLRGLERRAKSNLKVSGIASVASFFISRIDVAVDKELEAKDKNSSLLGKIAIANAKVTYKKYEEIFSSERFKKLAALGAQDQRLLWASTSTKNPKYRDVLYVEELIGKNTVNTLPPATIKAFIDHGRIRPSLAENVEEAEAQLKALASAGISLDKITTQLTNDAITLFSGPFDKLMTVLEKKRKALAHKPGGGAFNTLCAQLPFDAHFSVGGILKNWQESAKVFRLWQRDATLWTNDDEKKWLGWLDLPHTQLSRLGEFREIQQDFKNFKNIALLGMGGSSLCPEVLARTFGTKQGFPELHILDSTDPDQIRTLQEKLNLRETCFVVSSKSGTTLEPNIYMDYFFSVLQREFGKGAEIGKHFVAITDPGSALEKRARELKFRHVFHGVASVGGRYSALSDFGIIPALALGVDIEKFLHRTQEMVNSCSQAVPPEINPGVQLGALLAGLALTGRNKVTLVAASALEDLPAWIEQLIAESTGKNGKGLIPIVEQTFNSPEHYGNDRQFYYFKLEGEPDLECEAKIRSLQKAGHPVAIIELSDVYNLGREFFRWEFATAVVGSTLKINAFNQPDVEASKIETKRITTEFEKTGALPNEVPFFTEGSIELFTDEANLKELTKLVGDKKTLEAYVKAQLKRAVANDYVGLLAYLEHNIEHEETLYGFKESIEAATKVATTVQFGPRFLHSTGQAYKGGPNTGVFFQFTSETTNDLAVPDKSYSFGVVKAAQARGDFQVLAERKRRLLRLHFKGHVNENLKVLGLLFRRNL